MRGCIVYTFRKCGINVNRNLVIPCFKVITSCCNPKTKRGTQNIKRERERECVHFGGNAYRDFRVGKEGRYQRRWRRPLQPPTSHPRFPLSLSYCCCCRLPFFFFGFSLSWVWTMGRKNWRVEIMECMWRHWKMLVSNKSLSWTF